MSRNLSKNDKILYDATVARMITILEGLDLEFLIPHRDEYILKYLNDHKVQPEIVQQVELDIKQLNELQKKIDEKNETTDTVFKKVFPKLKFEYWDKMNHFKRRVLIYEIMEGMKNRGEL